MSHQGTCLNCAADLHGAFCSACGQRVMPPFPTIREMVGDAWKELSGYDGRFARTFRLLLRRPGALTLAVLQGRRAQFITPVRVYLVASIIYFLLGAAIPNVRRPPPAQLSGSNVTIVLTDRDGSGLASLPRDQQDEFLRRIDKAPWAIRKLLRPILQDPRSFKRRFTDTLAKVLFVLVPVFAAIVAMFYRGRRFSQHLVFALHLHGAIFIAFALRELSNLTRSQAVVTVFGIVAMVWMAAYALLAFRRVYRERWPTVVMKSIGILGLYLVASLAGLVIALAWTTMAAPASTP